MSENTILLPDKISFHWLILNLLGHDVYYDYNNIVSRVEAIEDDVLTELDLLIDNYHSLTRADTKPADFVAALESEKGQPYSVMLGGGGSDSNKSDEVKRDEIRDNEGDNNNEDVEEEEEEDVNKMKEYQKRLINIVIVKETEDEDKDEAEVKSQEKTMNSSLIKNINYESQVLSLKMQALLSNAKYSILQIANGTDANHIPMRSTPYSILEEGKEGKEGKEGGKGDNVLDKIVFKTIDKEQYATFLSQKWLPLVEISPLSYLVLSSEGEEDNEGEEGEQGGKFDYIFPTYEAIIKYTQTQILERIEEIKGRVVDKIGLLSLAPIFKVVIELSLIHISEPTRRS